VLLGHNRRPRHGLAVLLEPLGLYLLVLLGEDLVDEVVLLLALEPLVVAVQLLRVGLMDRISGFNRCASHR
jgi:hypothetical protein